jgi:hypothetical protein
VAEGAGIHKYVFFRGEGMEVGWIFGFSVQTFRFKGGGREESGGRGGRKMNMTFFVLTGTTLL